MKRVADSLTSLSPDDDDHHKMFAESPGSRHSRAVWNNEFPLELSLLDHLVRDFNLEEVKGEMRPTSLIWGSSGRRLH